MNYSGIDTSSAIQVIIMSVYHLLY